jgi:zinc protease
MLPKKTRGESVSLSLTLRYGTDKTLGDKTVIGEFLPTMMTRGTRKYTRTQLNDKLAQLRATLSGSGNSSSAGVANFSVRATRETLPEVLELLRQVLRHPTLPEQELALMKQRALSGLEQQKAEPQALAMNLLRRAFRPFPETDPRYQPTIDEEMARVKALDRAGLASLYENFLSSEHGELAIVGDFDVKTTLPLLESLLGDWKSSQPYRHILRDGSQAYKPGAHKILTPDKANAFYGAGLVFSMKDSHPDYPSLVISNYILGGGSLASRLGTRVRQKEGLSYGIFSMFRAGSVNQRGSLTIVAISNPQNSPKVVTSIRDEIDKFLKSGVTPKELAAAQKGYLQRLKVGRTDDARLAGLLASSLFAKRTLKFHAEFEQRLAETTPESILGATRKYFDPRKLVVVTAGDFNKKPAKTPAGKKKAGKKKASTR